MRSKATREQRLPANPKPLICPCSINKKTMGFFFLLFLCECVCYFLRFAQKKKRPYNWPSQKKKSKGKKVMFCFSSQPFSTRPIMKKTAFVWQRCFGSGNRFFFSSSTGLSTYLFFAVVVAVLFLLFFRCS